MFSSPGCAAAGKRLKEPSHKRNIEKTLVKCTQWHVMMNGKKFDYKRAFCYAWKNRDKKGKVIKKDGEPTWHVRVFDVVDYHEMFVQRGVWIAK